MPVDNLGKLWRRCDYPENERKIVVDKVGDKPGGKVDNLGITLGKPVCAFVTIVAKG